MSNTMATLLIWCVLLAHVAVLAVHRRSTLNLVPMLNLVVALAVVGYWVTEWIGYVRRNITWYATDQLVPAYALLVCLLSILTLTRRVSAPRLNWVVFGADLVVVLAAALYFAFFRMKRLF